MPRRNTAGPYRPERGILREKAASRNAASGPRSRLAPRVAVAAPWDGGVCLADTSAWVRARHVEHDWQAAVANGQIATCDVVVLELLYSARDGADFDDRAGELGLLRTAPIGPAVLATAKAAFRALAQRHPLFHRSVSVPDLITAAAAANAGIGVLHYDVGYDTLAEVLPFESRWIAPRGSID